MKIFISKTKFNTTYIILMVYIILAIYPIYWMLITSLKESNEIYSIIPIFFPKILSFNSYVYLFKETEYIFYLFNSIYIGIITTVFSVSLSILTAYAIARLKFRGKKYIARSILYSYLIPRSVLYIPLYLFIGTLGLLNMHEGLLISYPTFIIPYATWMLVTYFKTIPNSLENAAIIDGCSYIQVLTRVILPISIPGIMSVAIFSFTMSWGEYLYALVIVTSNIKKTIPIGLSEMIVDDFFNWGSLMAGAVFASIPIIGLYMISSNFLVTGKIDGGIKG